MTIYELKEKAAAAEYKYYTSAETLSLNEQDYRGQWRKHCLENFMEALEALTICAREKQLGATIDMPFDLDALIQKLETVETL